MSSPVFDLCEIILAKKSNKLYLLPLKYQKKLIESFEHDSEGICGSLPNMIIHPKGSLNTNSKEVRHYSSHYSDRLSVHPNDLVVNLMAQPSNNSRYDDICQIICLP
jgi:hypothetical protein